MPRLSRPSGYQYNRDSVERALTHHFTAGHKGWTSNAKGGYTIYTEVGIIELRTLREAALVAIACAEKGRRLEREKRRVEVRSNG
jgi:hypothetical protein